MSELDGNDGEPDRRARLGELGRVYLEALLAGETVAAEVAVREAMDAKLSFAEIDEQIIEPARRIVQELRQRGEVAAGHFAAEISIRVLALQREARRVALARASHRVMLATPGGDPHVVALRMVDNLLREAGYDTVMLGADVHADALVASSVRQRPSAICMSATLPDRLNHLMDAIDAVRRRCPGVGFVLGGAALADQLRFHADVRVCQRVSEAVDAVDAMIQRAAFN